MTRRIPLLLPTLFLISFTTVHAQWSSDPNQNTPICRAGNNQTAPKIISDGQGGAIICWTDERVSQNTFDIYAQRIDEDGFVQWTVNGAVVCDEWASQSGPDIAADGEGGAIITWTDTRNGDNDIYAQRIDASGNVLWTPEGVAVATGTLNQADPKVTTDGKHGAIITWNAATGGFPPTSKIYAMRLGSDGTPLWTGESLVSGSLRFSNAPSIAPDGSGGAYIAYAYFPRPEYDVYAQRIDSNGTVLWDSRGVGIATGSGTQDSPLIVPDGNGNAFLGYLDWGSGATSTVHAIVLKRNGSTAGGQRITSTSGGQNSHKLWNISPGLCGITWEDGRNTGITKAYAQIFDTTGQKRWAADGVEVSSRSGNQAAPFVISDGDDGLIIAWEDKSGGTLKTEIWAQRLSDTGTPLWTTAGVAVSTADNIRQFPRMIPDGANGAIITWEDYRPSFSNVEIYASRVLGDGTFPVGPPMLVLSEKSIAFGVVALGNTETESIRLTNSGGVPLTITGITSSDAQFSLTTDTTTIEPTGSVMAEVAFHATSKSTTNAYIVIESNSFLGPDTIRVSGRGTGSASIETDQRFLNFGTVSVGASRALALNIENSGNDTLIISSITSSDPRFTVDVASRVLLPDSSFNDTVRFSPTSPGPASGELTIVSNAPTSPTIVPLSGTGTTEVTLTIDPESISFGEVFSGSSVDTTVTLTNGGNDTLRISSFTSGDPSFTLESPITDIAPGSAEICTIRFTPSALGPVSSTFTITSNAASSPHTISVDGIGAEEAGISFIPSQLSFGDVGVGRQKDLVLMIRSTGSQTLTVTGITSTNPDFTALIDQFEVPGGTGFEDTIRFAPSVIGARSGMLIIASNAATSPDTVLVDGTGTDVSPVHQTETLPDAFTLSRNYPNPFHVSTGIDFRIPRSGQVQLAVYNLFGRRIALLVDRRLSAGTYHAQFDGASLPAGVYLFRIEWNGRSITRMMTRMQ